MSCANNSNLVAKICGRNGISGSVARGVFYISTTLAISAGTTALAYLGLQSSRRKTDREVFATLGDIQLAAVKGRAALAPDTPNAERDDMLTSAGELLIEAMGRVKKLPLENPFRRACAVQVDRLAEAVIGAAEVIQEPGDIAKTERIQSVFKSGQYAMLYPLQADHSFGKALLVGGVAGTATLGVIRLIERKRRQTQQSDPLSSVGTDTNPIDIPSTPKAASQVARRTERVTNIRQINWKQRNILDGGGYALVYEVAPGVVAKVGDIKPNEAWLQQYYAEKKQALPVLDYQLEVALPAEVNKECCPLHGLRREILPEQGYSCTCGKPQAVLLMPKAELPEDLKSEEVRAFMMGFSKDCEQEFGFYWDARPKNVARYEGRWVALDFGEEFEEGVLHAPVGWKPTGMGVYE